MAKSLLEVQGEKKTFTEILDVAILIQVLLWIADLVFTSQLFPTEDDMQGTAGMKVRDGEALGAAKIYAQKNAKAAHASGMK